MRRNIKNESGFTMIELLATITILGILMGVAIGAVSWILDLNEKRYYSTLEKNVALAAESYYADHRAPLPSAIGQSRKLLLKTLVEQKYLPDVLDYGKGDCTASLESYVVVTKYSKKDYLYNVYFDCPAYKTRQEDAIKDLSITINFDYDDKKVKESKVNIKINSTEDNKIASYEYIIYKDGQNVYNSENVSAGYVDNINRQVKLKDYVPGNIRIVVTAYDMYGNKKTKEKEVAIYNNGLPECGTESPVYNKWTNAKDAKRKVTIKCVNGDITCLRRNYSETFTSDMKTGYITITGTNNQEKKCPVGVYIDKTPPVCGSNDGSKVWTNKNRTVKVQCSDATSGCTKENGYSKTFSKTTQEGKIEIKDNAGNTKECEVDVYVDKTPPKCVVTKENNSWTNKDVTVEVQCTDGESGCKKSTYSEVITSTTKTKTITVSDKAGNTATCTANAYVDKSKPTVPTSEIRINNSTGAIQKNQNKWTSNTLWWGNFKSTSTSGIDHYEFSEGCTGTKSGNLASSYTYDKDKNTTYCIRAVSKAGVASDWSSPYYFKIDKTPPACPSIYSSVAENTWTNQNITFTFNFSSDTSKYVWYTKTKGASSWEDWVNHGENSTSVNSKTISGEGLRKIGVRVYDVAGNSQLCGTTPTYKIDKTAPYTPYLDINSTVLVDGVLVYANIYGDCDEACHNQIPDLHKRSVELQQNRDACFNHLSCNIGSKSKSEGKCLFSKKYACGGFKWTAEDDTSKAADVSGVNSIYCLSWQDYGCVTGSNQGDYSETYFQAIDNAGNVSAKLKVTILNYHMYTETVLNKYYESRNFEWVLKSGMSRPAQFNNSCYS